MRVTTSTLVLALASSRHSLCDAYKSVRRSETWIYWKTSDSTSHKSRGQDPVSNAGHNMRQSRIAKLERIQICQCIYISRKCRRYFGNCREYVHSYFPISEFTTVVPASAKLEIRLRWSEWTYTNYFFRYQSLQLYIFLTRSILVTRGRSGESCSNNKNVRDPRPS